MSHEVQIPAIIIPTLVKVAARMGLSIPRLLNDCGLEINSLQNNDALIPFTQLNCFMEAMVKHSGSPAIGLYLGNNVDFDYLPDFEVFIRTASTPREAIRAVSLFQQFSPFFNFELKEKQALGEAHLIISMSAECSEQLESVYLEMFVVLIDRFAKILLGDLYQLKKLVLGFRLNAALKEYREIFDAPIEAGATFTAIILDQDILDVHLQSALPIKNKQAEKDLQRLIKGALDKHGYKAKVMEIMCSDINLASASVAEIAEKMQISVRGMQRRLKEEETTFSHIQLEARMAFALQFLSENRLAIEDISDQLGFSNRRSFSRAFHQWYGTSPSSYRKLVLHGSLKSNNKPV